MDISSSVLSVLKNRKTTNLLLGNTHVILDIREDGALHEVSSITQAFASALQLGSFLLAAFNQLQDLVQLIFINLW